MCFKLHKKKMCCSCIFLCIECCVLASRSSAANAFDKLWPTPYVNRVTSITGCQPFWQVFFFFHANTGTVLFTTMALPNQMQLWTLPWENLSFKRPHQHSNRLRDKRGVWFKRSGRLWVRHSSLQSCPVHPSQPPWPSTATGKLIAMRTMRSSWKEWVSDLNCW